MAIQTYYRASMDLVDAQFCVDTVGLSNDPATARAIKLASQVIEHECRRKFKRDDYVLDVDGWGTPELAIPNHPIHTLTSVASLANGTAETMDTTGVVIDPDGWLIWRDGRCWEEGTANYRVTCNAGIAISATSPDFPYDLKLAAALLARFYLDNKTLGVELRSSADNAEGQSIAFIERGPSGMPADVEAILKRYRWIPEAA